VYLDPNPVLSAAPGRAHDDQILAVGRQASGPCPGIISLSGAMQRGTEDVGTIWTTLDSPPRPIKLKNDVIVRGRSLRYG
jgi:hypothetical protein